MTWNIDPRPPQDHPAACGDPFGAWGHSIHSTRAAIHSSTVSILHRLTVHYESAPFRRRARAWDGAAAQATSQACPTRSVAPFIMCIPHLQRPFSAHAEQTTSTGQRAAHAVDTIEKLRDLHGFRVPSASGVPPGCSESIASSAQRSSPSCCTHRVAHRLRAQTRACTALQGVDGMSSLLQRGPQICSSESRIG